MAILKNGGTATRLADSQKSLEGLEARREVLVREHQSSVEERRTLLLDGTNDIKLLSKADSRVAAAEGSLAGVEDAATLLRDELHIVVTDCGNGIWEWEICRQGEPLPARMRDGPFGSEEVALAAGKIALREFLELWNPNRKGMTDHSSKRPDQQIRGRRLGFLGLGLNRVYSIALDGVEALSRQQPTERKSATLGLNALAIQTTQ